MIDVIICAYNAHKYLSKALDSIAIQSILQKLKITIINDGSDYDYSKICAKHSFNIEEIKLKKNHGLGYARKIGFKKTKGKYFIFLDCDDTFYDNKSLENLYNYIEEKPQVSFIAGKILIDNKQQHCLTFMHGKLYRRDFIKKNKITFLNLYTYEDLAFNLAVIFAKGNYKLSNDITYIYNQNIKNSITQTNNDKIKVLKSFIKAYNYALKKAKDINIVKNITKDICEDLFTIYTENINLFINEYEKVSYLKICKKFFKRYKKYIITTSNIAKFKNILKEY